MADVNDKRKRERAANFSPREINLLVELVVKYQNVVECKKTDALTWRQKEETWGKLCAEFNSLNDGPPRTLKCLKSKYESFKKDLKKKVAANKLNMSLTGGGKYISQTLSPVEEKIYGLLQFTIDGLPSRNDDDLRLQQTSPSEDMENIEIIFDDDVNKMQELSTTEISNIENETNDIPENGEDENLPQENQNIPNNWARWNPAALRRHKSTQLQVRRRRRTKTSQDEAVQGISVLSASKKELVELQKQVLKEEMEYKTKEWNLKLQKAEIDLEVAKFELKIKKTEADIKEQALKKFIV